MDQTNSDLPQVKNLFGPSQEDYILLETIFASAPVGLAFLDRELRYVRLNEALARVNGLPIEAHLGRTPAELLPGILEIDQMMAAWRQILVTGEPLLNVETSGKTPAAPGETRYWLNNWYPIHSHGQVAGIGAIVQDITERKRAEATLQESEERYSSLFANNHAVMLLIDPLSGDIVDANPAACAFYGYSYDELKRRKITEINTLPDEEVAAEMERARSDRRHYFNFRHRLASGAVRDVEVYSGPIKVQGKPLLYSIIHDVTDRTQAEAALQEREELFRQLAENIRHVFWMRDIRTNQMVYVSPAYEEIWGQSPERLYQDPTSFIEAVHPEDKARVIAALRRQTPEQLFNEEYRIVTPDGLIRWIWNRSFPVPDEHGQVYRLAGIAEDISQIKQVELALEQQADALREQAHLIDLAYNSIMVWDMAGRLNLWNTGATEMYGWSKIEALGQNIHSLLQTRFPEPLPAIHSQLLRQGRWEGELIQFNRQGERLVVASRWALQRDRYGQPAKILEISLDITEIRRTEQAQRLLAETGQLLASSLDYETTLAGVAQLAVPLLADWCIVYIIGEDKSVRQLRVVHPDPARVELVAELERRYPVSLDRWSSLTEVWQGGRAELYPEITEAMLVAVSQDTEHLQLMRQLGMRSAMLAPLAARGRTFGAIFFIAAESGRRYDEADLALAEELARRAALAVDNARLFQAEHQARQASERALQEKEVLLREVHHRVKNNLQAVSNLVYLQTVHNQDRQVQAMLQETQDRIKSIALIHEKLYQTESLARIDFAEYVDSLARHLINSYKIQPKAISLKVQAQAISLNVDTAVPLGVITNELVSNALKHAFPDRTGGEISIDLQLNSGGQLTLTVSDDGVGLPATLDPYQTGTLGLQLVNMLTSHMGGTVEVVPQPRGTTFRIRFMPQGHEPSPPVNPPYYQ